jgi:hypothetical protein
VVFVGNPSRFETRTNLSGDFEINIPSGTYFVAALKDGTCGVRRSDFHISRGERLHFDFELVICPSDSNRSESYPYGEESIPADHRAGRPEIRIAFGEHASTGTLDIYKSFLPPHSILPFRVTVTADKYTIRALKVTLYRNTMNFVAEGDVEISDGSKTEMVKSARLSYQAGVPKIEIGDVRSAPKSN